MQAGNTHPGPSYKAGVAEANGLLPPWCSWPCWTAIVFLSVPEAVSLGQDEPSQLTNVAGWLVMEHLLHFIPVSGRYNGPKERQFQEVVKWWNSMFSSSTRPMLTKQADQYYAVGKTSSCRNRQSWFQIPAQSLTSCVTLGSFVSLLEPQFPLL